MILSIRHRIFLGDEFGKKQLHKNASAPICMKLIWRNNSSSDRASISAEGKLCYRILSQFAHPDQGLDGSIYAKNILFLVP